MKKYLLIPALLIATITAASANCGGCGEKKSCEAECKKECCAEEAKCCGGKPEKGKSCCNAKKDHTHEKEAVSKK